jgi:hypothetical protein
MGESGRASIYVNANRESQQLAMGESNMDDIDRRIVEDDKFDTRDKVSKGQTEQPPTGKLGEIYVLLGKGLSLGQIASELRMKESEVRELLKVKAKNEDTKAPHKSTNLHNANRAGS